MKIVALSENYAQLFFVMRNTFLNDFLGIHLYFRNTYCDVVFRQWLEEAVQRSSSRQRDLWCWFEVDNLGCKLGWFKFAQPDRTSMGWVWAAPNTVWAGLGLILPIRWKIDLGVGREFGQTGLGSNPDFILIFFITFIPRLSKAWSWTSEL